MCEISRMTGVRHRHLEDSTKKGNVVDVAINGKADTANGVVQPSQLMTSPLRDAVELILCTASIYVCYVGYGILHEGLTRHPFGQGANAEKFKYSTFLTTAQCTGNAVWALLLLFIEAFRRARSHGVTPQHPHSSAAEGRFTFTQHLKALVFDPVPKYKYAIVAASYSIAMLSSTAALQYLSYPVQVS